MTCDERIEALLNRVGQTISDLPREYTNIPVWMIINVLGDWCTDERGDLQIALFEYILHLTDIIDRMETALENVCGERDWLVKRFHCYYCKHYESNTNFEPCKSCLNANDDPGYELDFDKPIVPEDWSADDD